MTTSNKLHWEDALQSIKEGKSLNPKETELEFDGKMVFWKDAMVFGKSGFTIPQEVIDYDDENIDFSDDPDSGPEFWKDAVSAKEGGEREYMRRKLLAEIEDIPIEYLPALLEVARAFKKHLPPAAPA